MIKFIIVEDDDKTIDAVKKLINKVIFRYDINYEFSTHQKYEASLAKEIKDESITKIYIMDIDLGTNKSGIQIAEEIRDNDWESIIIFITSHDRMFDTVYRKLLNVFDFIEKFDNFNERLSKDITKIAKHKFDTKTFDYSIRNIDLRIPLKAINYIYRDSNERKLVIKTDTNEYFVNMNISEIVKKLDYRFIKVHRSCIVNKEVITKINWNKGYFEVKGDKGNLVYFVSKKYKELLK